MKRRDGLCLTLHCYEVLDVGDWERGFCQAHQPIAAVMYYAKPEDGPRAWSLAWRKRWEQSYEGEQDRG